jgi:hypothetical protein
VALRLESFFVGRLGEVDPAPAASEKAWPGIMIRRAMQVKRWLSQREAIRASLVRQTPARTIAACHRCVRFS